MLLGSFWKKFVGLIPSSPRQVGKVITSHGDNKYTVELMGGGLLKVYSSTPYNVDDRVFVEKGAIVSKASTLPSHVIEV